MEFSHSCEMMRMVGAEFGEGAVAVTEAQAIRDLCKMRCPKCGDMPDLRVFGFSLTKPLPK